LTLIHRHIRGRSGRGESSARATAEERRGLDSVPPSVDEIAQARETGRCPRCGGSLALCPGDPGALCPARGCGFSF
jgi:hypothetical protein